MGIQIPSRIQMVGNLVSFFNTYSTEREERAREVGREQRGEQERKGKETYMEYFGNYEL